jgi:hypothetical protein
VVGKPPYKVCGEKGKVLQPRGPKPIKFLHIIYKEPSLYDGIKSFLHLYIRYILYDVTLVYQDTNNISGNSIIY